MAHIEQIPDGRFFVRLSDGDVAMTPANEPWMTRSFERAKQAREYLDMTPMQRILAPAWLRIMFGLMR